MIRFITNITSAATVLLFIGISSASAQEMFAKVDSNGDGALDKAEFTAFIDAAAEAGRPNAKKVQSANLYARAFGRIDKNRDGAITPDELAAMR